MPVSYKHQINLPIITKFQDSHLLKGLENFAGDGLGRSAEVGGLGSPPFASTVHLGERFDSSLATAVDVAGGGSAPDVVPVTVVGSHFLEGGGLDKVTPFWDLKAARPDNKFIIELSQFLSIVYN